MPYELKKNEDGTVYVKIIRKDGSFVDAILTQDEAYILANELAESIHNNQEEYNK